MLVGPKNVFGPDSNPKNSPKGPKKCKKSPKCDQIKNKKIELYFQNQSWLSTYVGPKNIFEPDPDPKNSLEGPNRASIIQVRLFIDEFI